MSGLTSLILIFERWVCYVITVKNQIKQRNNNVTENKVFARIDKHETKVMRDLARYLFTKVYLNTLGLIYI